MGHLFQGASRAIPITDDAHLWMTSAYIANNPVDAGLCRRPDEWPWSSHPPSSPARAPEWLDRDRNSTPTSRARAAIRAQRYADFVSAAAKIKGQSL